jgi:hypothetical protein
MKCIKVWRKFRSERSDRSEVVGMNRQEWQKYHGFDDQDMALISAILKEFNGSIVSIKERNGGEK